MNLGIGLRNLSRVREIVSVLVFDYGFGYVFDQLGLSRQLPVGRRRRPAREYADLPGPRRLRLALAELGPTFIKLGQILGARGDLLPPAVVSELRHLQDEGPVVPFPEVRGVIERELGRPIEQAFATIERDPLSSASLGQVHAATLKDGREVTVKVLRPGVRKVVETDLQIFSDAAALLPRQVQALRRYNLPSFVRRFVTQMEDEMSYTIEAYNAGRLEESLAAAQVRARIPRVVWELTTREVLTTERVRGHRADRLATTAPAVDRKAAAEEIGRTILRQIFVDGFFHGDPHQGNMLVGDDGAIVLLDFGIMGYLDPRTRRLLGEAVRRVYEQDVDGLVTAMSELGTVGADTDPQSLRNELAQIVSRFMLLPRRDFPMGEVLMRTLRALWTNNVRVPPELPLTAKALLMAEAVATDLDPDFDFRDLAEPVLREARAREMVPSALADRASRSLEATARRLSRLPARLDRVLSLIEHGGLRVRVEDRDIDSRWGRMGRVLNRLGLSLLTVGLLITGALFLVVGEHPTHVGLGTASLIAAVLTGLIVVVRALRPGQL
ncbi:MAG TPA: AarF/UbiB family protein [Armatimonadota bacterium]|nr:AarF/UbiB family protein [Armatimonadota bacterium]